MSPPTTWTRTLRSALRRTRNGAVSHSGLLVVLGVSFASRLSLLRWWKAFPGGDTYNFILIAQELLRGSYPIAEKRLPVYPLLVALGGSFLDWETSAIAVALVSSLAAVALFYALGRTIGLSKTALVVALLPFQAVAPFLFQSIRGYADTTFVALFLGSLLALLRMRTWRGALLTGALLGAASLTRFEGMVLAPFLLLAGLALPSRRLLVPALAAVIASWVPFLVLSASVGRPLLPNEYLEDAERTPFGVTTARAFAANYATAWRSVGLDRFWGEPLRLARDARTVTIETLPNRAKSFLTDPKEAPSLLLLAGLVAFLARPRVFLPFLLSFGALALPLAWWGVRQRFLIVLYPFPFFLLAGGTDVLLRGALRLARRSSWFRVLPAAGAALLLGLSAGAWMPNNAAETREVNAKNLGKDYAYYLAIRRAKDLPGNIAFEHRSSIALALFGEPDLGRAVFADTHLNTPGPAEQWDALLQWRVRSLVVRGTTSEAFPVLSALEFRDRFHVTDVFRYPAPRGLDHATIYQVNSGLP